MHLSIASVRWQQLRLMMQQAGSPVNTNELLIRKKKLTAHKISQHPGCRDAPPYARV